jgi:hypothetical protein
MKIPKAMQPFESRLSAAQRKTMDALTSPIKIQAFLDATPYSPENQNRNPLRVMTDHLAHCLDGGLFGALALRRLGYPPLIVDLLPDPGMDDDHVLAIFKKEGCLGAVAKSNFAGLRYREPVYRTMRELIMSYFEDFYNVNGLRTLRYYTVTVDLSLYDATGWMVDDKGCDVIEEALKHLRKYRLISPAQGKALHPVDELSYRSGTICTNPDGLYKPMN